MQPHLHDDLDEVLLPELLPRARHQVRVHLHDAERSHALRGQGTAGGRQEAQPAAAGNRSRAVERVVVDVGGPICWMRMKQYDRKQPSYDQDWENQSSEK